MLPPDGVVVDEPSPSRLIALSPDGRRLAFVGFGADRRRMLWVRSLDSLTAQQLNGTEDAFSPFWSPDSRNIGFFSGINGGKLKTVDLDGGPPTTLCDYLGNPAGADWSPDGVIFFSTLPEGSMRRVSAAGGASTVVIAPDAKAGESNFWWPVFLPDRQHFLYLTLSSGRTPLGVFVATLDGRERKLVLKGGSNVKYADGRLLFLRNTTLMAQPFDLSRLELEGDAVPIAEQIQSNPPTGAFTVSQTGILAYKTGEATGAARLTWYDTAGRQLGTVGSAAAYGDVRLAPDGKRATVSLPSPSAGGRDVWIVDLSRDLATRFTFDAAEDTSTIWSPDGTRIVYRSMRNGYADLYEKPSSGATAETLLLSDKSTKVPLSWSSDGKYILYGVSNPTDGTGGGAPIGDVWVLPLEGDRKPFPFLNSRFGEGPARFSPDGRWVAYQSNESGRPEVYVAPFPGPGGKWQVSTNGGGLPMWNPNGKEILFFAQTPGRLMTAPVTASAGSIDVGTVKPLFSLRPGGPRGFYDVAPDGRLLVIAGAQLAEQSPITLVVNWAGKSRD
jgi:eukaryotic-like serine/threonine-protein kinase